ncbi:RHS repeat domain-containing protein [Peijinzhouia sedimentorum]
MLFLRDGYEYHYYHKDHLGNIRQVFRAESTTTYMATMEPENETQEMQQFFHNLSDSRSIDARYNQTEGGRAVAWLDASRGRDYGPVWSKELAQGDSLHAAVLGMLYDPKEKLKFKDLLTGIGRQNTLRTGLEGTNLTGTSSLGLQPLWLALQLARQLEKAPVPESYLGYILYDQDSIRYDSGRVEISRQAFTNPEELALDITATQGGFVEVYVYNSSASPVWYDQFSISSSQAVIIQENHYYPFGMQIAGLELDLDSKNRYKFNENEVLNDFELDLYDFNARFYDPSIGRFMGVDELANHPNQITMSPYQFGWNNPILYNDPSGLCPECGSEEEQSSSDEEDVVDEGKVLDEIVITHTQTQHEKNLTAGYQLGIYSGHAAFFSHGVTQSVMFGAGFLFAPEVYLLNRIGQGAASAIRPIVQNLKSFSFATKGGKELFNFSTKAAEHMANPGRAVPVQILEQAIKGSKGLADPRGSRALMHTTEMFKNGKRYNLEVLYDKATNSIWHFKYSPIKP